MKILLFSDVHWSERSSIVTKLDTKYTVRLEKLISSMNWVNNLAEEQGCSMMICAGDMMDKSNCTDMELTALNELSWNELPCYFLCGNHESSVASLEYSTVNVLASARHFIISEPTKIDLDDCELCFLPYLQDNIRKPLNDYFGAKKKRRIIVSHNDISGINYGVIVSKAGLPISEIENSADLFLNGHLHNSDFITQNILNLGSLSAHNFTNDSSRYKYGCWILDTQTLELDFFENPFALNFYQLDIRTEADISKLDKLKNNMVLKLHCRLPLIMSLNAKLSSMGSKVVSHKVIAIQTVDDDMISDLDASELTVDYLAELCSCCKSKIDNTPILDYELAQICK